MVDKYSKQIELNIKKYVPFKVDNFGKLIRSKIGLLILKSLNINVNSSYIDILTVVELIHLASLLHDDVIDNETVRRNSPSANLVYGNKLSVLYGNLIISNCLSVLIKIGNIELLSIFNTAIENMCQGEIIQSETLNKKTTIEDYIEKCKLKTASLFLAEAKALKIISNDISFDIEGFAESFGIAFQIKNDLDNILTTKSDIENGIYTAPVIFSDSISIDNTAIEKTKGLIDNYIEKGITLLNSIEDSLYKSELIRIVRCLKK